MKFESDADDQRELAEFSFETREYLGISHFKAWLDSISADPRTSEEGIKLLDGLGRKYGLYSLAFDESVYDFVAKMLVIAGDPDSKFLPIANKAYFESRGSRLNLYGNQSPPPTANIFRKIAQCFAFIVGGELGYPDHRTLHEAFCMGVADFWGSKFEGQSWYYDENIRLVRSKIRAAYGVGQTFNEVEQIIAVVGAGIAAEVTANQEFAGMDNFFSSRPNLRNHLKREVEVDGKLYGSYEFIKIHAPRGYALEDQHRCAALKAGGLCFHLGVPRDQVLTIFQTSFDAFCESHASFFSDWKQ